MLKFLGQLRAGEGVARLEQQILRRYREHFASMPKDIGKSDMSEQQSPKYDGRNDNETRIT